jgi:hypothetical protein
LSGSNRRPPALPGREGRTSFCSAGAITDPRLPLETTIPTARSLPDINVRDWPRASSTRTPFRDRQPAQVRDGFATIWPEVP